MYYYTKLGSMSSNINTVKVFILSYLLTRGKASVRVKRERLQKLLKISRMQVYRILQDLISKGLIDEELKVQIDIEEYRIPYINVPMNKVEKLGLKEALYRTWRKERPNAKRMSNLQASKEIGMSPRTVQRLKRKPKKRSEDVFRKGRTVKSGIELKKEVIENQRQILERKVSPQYMLAFFRTAFDRACKENKVKCPPPSKTDLYKVLALDKQLKKDNYEISTEQIIDYMIKKWDALTSMDRVGKPSLPDIGKIYWFYKEVCSNLTSKSEITFKEVSD